MTRSITLILLTWFWVSGQGLAGPVPWSGLPKLKIDKSYPAFHQFSRHFVRWKLYRHLPRHEKLALSTRVLELKSEDGLIPLPTLEKHFSKAFIKHLKIDHAKAKVEIDSLNKAEKNRVLTPFYDYLAQELMRQSSARKWFDLGLKHKVSHDSNVVQTPDGETTVSDRGGAHLKHDLSFKLKGREFYQWGSFAFGVQAGDTNYFDNAFENRNAQYFNLQIDNRKKIKHKLLRSLTSKLSFRTDYLRSSGSKERSFTTLSPGTSLMWNPWKKKSPISDFFVHVTSIDLGWRDYLGSDKLDANGNNKDTFTPSLTALLLSFKKSPKRKYRGLALFNLRKPSTDSKDLEYLAMRFGLSWSVIFPRWQLTPDIAYALRDQANYQGQTRNDDTFEAGLALKKSCWNDRIKTTAKVRHIEQRSNTDAFTYDNTQVSLEISCDF